MEQQHNKKRTHYEFEASNKSQAPSYGPPNGKPFFFSDMPLPPTPSTSPFRAPSFTTPRKIDVDFSSGPENSSPVEADNEETPDGKFEFKASPPKSTKSTKRNSLFGMYGRFAPTSSRITRPFSDVLERRIHKRRRRALDKQQMVVVRRDSDVASSDDEPITVVRRSPSKQHDKALPPPPPQPEPHALSSFFSLLSSNPDLPAILSRYLQVFFNFALLTFFGWIIFSFYQTVRADVDRAGDEAVAVIISEIKDCNRQYLENNCMKPLPALEQTCSNWKICMERDPQAVKRAQLSAQTFAQIFNSFVEPISFRTLAFSVIIVVTSFVVSNATFVYLRRPHDNYQSHPPQYMSHPSASYQHPSYAAPPAQVGYMPNTPALPYEPQTPSTERRQNDTAWGENRQIEWHQSPSKGQGARGRSRSPEKRAY
ncbi:Nucleus export protein brr6 [Cyphellophora attinorum]|uniref:Nucleus export protein brr6 n=1 Tax=Cyphellophora attinorum TaxID=1664694 RepID=A0A0N1HBB0_9EURO|nr:Nucleus export protein brr6 [Phialophora attinorum]KPI41310.1 Nucleus export protein brr6 [Phialophora attinorum]